MKQTFYSNGKLLLTGEYLVLDGAVALALPTKFGQDLVIEEGADKIIRWKSFDSDGSIWFDDTLSFEEISNNGPFQDESIKSALISLLHQAFLLNPEFLEHSEGYNVETHLGFLKLWGLGSSSTLVNNIAQWLQIDAFTLLKNSFGGSGYDIACAQRDTPILYQLADGNTIIREVYFNPTFSAQLYFVYLNQKQNSPAAIASYRNSQQNVADKIAAIDIITQNVLKSTDVETFASELRKHEKIMAEILNADPIQDKLFADFSGTVKSLGAWGGDFVIVVSKENPTAYFQEKGFETILPFSEMIL